MFKRLFQRLIQLELEAYILFREPLNIDCNFKVSLPIGYELKVYKKGDMAPPSLIEFWCNSYCTEYNEFTKRKVTQQVASFFDAGDECFCIQHNGRVVGFMWVGFENNFMMRDMAQCLSDIANFCIIHRVFVAKEHRGNGLQKTMDRAVKANMVERKIEMAYIFIGAKNLASTINSMKTYSDYRLLYHVVLKLPKYKINFFPKLGTETWVSLKK